MELSQLRQFKVIAECNNMTKAANILHITQPTLSAMLKKFEQELGVLLFDRTANKISLNQAGEIALDKVNIILNQVDDLVFTMKDYIEKDNQISIGFCDPGPMWYILPKFSIKYPEIKIKDTLYEDTQNELDNILNQTYHIMITARKINHPEIESTLFVREQMLLSVPKDHIYATKKEISIKNEKPEDVYILETGGVFFTKIKKYWQEALPDINLNIYKDYFLFSQLIRNTNNITSSTIVSHTYSEKHSDRILIPVSDPELSINYYVSYKKSNKQKLLSFLKWIDNEKEDLNMI